MDGFIAHDRAGNCDGEQGHIEQERKEIALCTHLAPGAVDEVGYDSKCIKADAQRQRQIRNGNGEGKGGVDVFQHKSRVLESDEYAKIENQRQRQKQFSGALVTEAFQQPAEEVVDQCAEHQQPQERRLAPRIKQQGKDDQHCVAVGVFLGGKIAQEADGKEEIQKE